MRVAIVHDLMDRWGGSEEVVVELSKIFPGSDLYTLMMDREMRKRLGKDVKVHASWFERWLMVVPSRWRAVVKLFSWIYWDSLDLRDYDLIICSSHSYGCMRVRRKKNGAIHVAYVHSPPKYLYGEKAEWEWIKRMPIWGWLRKIDKIGAKRPDILVANSLEVKRRIEKYYGRRVKVIYPPVKMLEIKKEKGKYYLFFSRLTKQKGAELAVRVANKYGIELLVAGEGTERKYLESLAGQNVKFVGSRKDKERIFARAKALIYPAIDEDFGMVPVEAMSAGVPVVAYRSGGIRETVVDGVTGVFFEDYTVGGLIGAIRRLEGIKIDPNACLRQAKRFEAGRFGREIKKLVRELVGDKAVEVDN